MKAGFIGMLAAAVCATVLGQAGVAAPTPDAQADASATPRTADGHPDLSGNWIGFTGSNMLGSLPTEREANGSINAGLSRKSDNKHFGAGGGGTGGPAPNRPQPHYKTAADVAHAKDLWDHGEQTDNVANCGQPGVPRVGAPLKIIQTAHEVTFLYADWSGMAWRVIPTDGRGYRPDVDPSFYGDSVGHWEGDTLVVDARNFTTDTWFGEYGYFHSDQLRVVEKLTRHGNTYTYQATVYDPKVLAAPWVKPPVEMHRTDVRLEEPAKCIPTHYGEAMGHHIQRVP